MTEWDLSRESALRSKEDRLTSVGGTFAGVIALGVAVLVAERLAVVPGLREGASYFALATLLGAGVFFVWESLRVGAPGADRLRADGEGITMWYPRRPDRPRVLRWDSPRFRFAFRRDADPKLGGDGYCFESTAAWPPSRLSDDAFFGLVAAARAAGMEVRERRTLWGYRTRVHIGPRGPATIPPTPGRH